MGCGNSRALPVEVNNGPPDDGDGDLQPTQQKGASSRVDTRTLTSEPSGPSASAGVASKESTQSRNSETQGSNASSASAASAASAAAGAKSPTKSTGDSQVAVALRSKRRGILVEGTSVQPDANYVKKVVPKAQAAREMIAHALSGNVLFAALGTSGMEDMIDAMEQRHVPAGTTIITQGESGDNFYVIENGKFDILIGERKVADWGDGTNNRTVGELALLYGAPRAATVRATTDAHIWYIDRTTFRNVTAQGAHQSHQQLKAALRKGILEELSDEQLDKVAAAANHVRFAKGAQIIKKGDVGEVFYIIETGSVICRNLPGEQITNVLEAGDYFGERALMKQEPRACDVYAHTDASLIAVSREDFESLLGQIGELLEQNLGMRLLLCVPILQQLQEDHRVALFSQVKILVYKPGQAILHQNSPVSQFFILKEGEAQVSVTGDTDMTSSNPNAGVYSKLQQKIASGNMAGRDDAAAAATAAAKEDGSRVLGNLVVGQWFGEDEVVAQAGSAANYIAVGTVQCFVVERDTFKYAIAPYLPRTPSHSTGSGSSRSKGSSSDEQKSISSTNNSSKSSEGKHRGSSEAKGSGAGDGADLTIRAPENRRERPTRARLGIPFRELEQRATLGTGTFGRVRLVYHKKTNRVFALKMLKKAQIVALRQQANIMNEKELLWKVDHPFVIRLYDTYKDQDRLYMLLELVQGGELFARLQNSSTPGRVTPSDARFYAGCVLDAFEHLHGLSIVYRDLKPENLLIDAEGYMKIVDFGFAKIVKDRTYTLCGTPEYLAPELVLGKGHDKGVDYWALGILLYEQVAGYSPFADQQNNDQMVICKKILKAEVDFPPHFKDKDLKDLILKLLVKDLPKRLGCMRGGAQEIKEHRFFRGLDFSELVRKRVPAPWKPELSNPLDTHHFDDYDEDDELEKYHDDGSNWEKDF